jgi:hypothetical protein
MEATLIKLIRKKCCVARARQNARSDRVCLDFSLVTFFVVMTKKVTIKIKDDDHHLVVGTLLITEHFLNLTGQQWF